MNAYLTFILFMFIDISGKIPKEIHFRSHNLGLGLYGMNYEITNLKSVVKLNFYGHVTLISCNICITQRTKKKIF